MSTDHIYILSDHRLSLLASHSEEAVYGLCPIRTPTAAYIHTHHTSHTTTLLVMTTYVSDRDRDRDRDIKADTDGTIINIKIQLEIRLVQMAQCVDSTGDVKG